MSIAMLERAPVAAGISQGWKENATAGVIPDPNGTTVQQLVAKYGDYQSLGHDGIDWNCFMRTLVVAPGAGVIDWAGWSHEAPRWVTDKYGYLFRDTSGGIVVYIDHGNGLATALLHLDETGLNAGERVRGGDPVGLSGTTGRSGGPHVHQSLIELAFVYVTPMYGRINPLSRIPAGLTIPLVPGGTGDAAGPADTIAGIPGLTVGGAGMATPAENQAAFEQLCKDAAAIREHAVKNAEQGAMNVFNWPVLDALGRMRTPMDLVREVGGIATPLEWMGPDGKKQTGPRKTTTVATSAQWSDAGTGAILRENQALKELVRQLAVSTGAVIDYDEIARVVNDEEDRRNAERLALTVIPVAPEGTKEENK
ncbi:M23 family metallopeptidase [Arthrobacter sp. TmT3-37]